MVKSTIAKETRSKKTEKEDKKLEAVRMAMEKIEKQYGRGAIMKLGQRTDREGLEVISTGSIPLDLALGVGGIPRGRIVEIYGPEASGKTTLTLSIIAEAQKKGGVAAFIDAEHGMDSAWAKKIGVKVDDLLLSQPDTGEQALEIAETLIRSGGVDVIVIDSVAALVPKAEIEGEMGDAMVGVQARLMSQALRKLTGVISKSKTICIFTNQIRHKIGIIFGSPETTSGGLALKFYSSIRLDTRKIATLKDKDEVVGSRHRIKVVKNKVAPPFKKVEIDILGEEGISYEGGVIDTAVELEILKKSGAFYKYKGDVLAQGKQAVKAYLKKHPQLTKKLVDKIWQAAKKKKD